MIIVEQSVCRSEIPVCGCRGSTVCGYDGISLDDPHTLRISVTEKGILGSFYIDRLGQYAYFDKDGFVVETSSM